MPRSVTGMAAVKDWIFVVDFSDKSLRVYNWCGEEVGRLSDQQLGLGGEDIYGIGQAEDSGLHIAAGINWLIVNSMHLYHTQ